MTEAETECQWYEINEGMKREDSPSCTSTSIVSYRQSWWRWQCSLIFLKLYIQRQSKKSNFHFELVLFERRKDFHAIHPVLSRCPFTNIYSLQISCAVIASLLIIDIVFAATDRPPPTPRRATVVLFCCRRYRCRRRRRPCYS